VLFLKTDTHFLSILDKKILRTNISRTLLYRKQDTFILLNKYFKKCYDLYDTVENNIDLAGHSTLCVVDNLGDSRKLFFKYL